MAHRIETADSLRQAAIRETVAAWKEWAHWVQLEDEDEFSREQLSPEIEAFASRVNSASWGRSQQEKLRAISKLATEARELSEEARRIAPRLRWIREESQKLLTLYLRPAPRLRHAETEQTTAPSGGAEKG